MKQSLQLKIGQHLTMTPQLQQAIKLLQLPSLELRNEIQEMLDSNPMLESVETEGEAENSAKTDSNEPAAPTTEDSSPLTFEQSDTAGANGQSSDGGNDLDIAAENRDSDWDSYSSGGKQNSSDVSDREFYERQDLSEPSLQEHLLWQLHLSQMSATDQAIASAIIDAITDDGYLTEELATIHAAVSSDFAVDIEEVEAVLHRVQHLDPIGVAARNPAECLWLQLNTYPDTTPGYALAQVIIQEHLPLLAAHDYARLKRITKTDEAELRDAETLIQSLNPRPGASITQARTEYIVPDVFVSKKHGAWRAELNPDLSPRLRINSMYAGMIRRADKSDDNNYLKTNLQEARWFLKSLQSRNDTILKVAKSIIERQRGFLDYGEVAMKPLVLRDIAETLDMHESTISRVTNQKYMHTPRGIYEFKHFFSSHVSTVDGGECSATAIRAMLKKLILDEDQRKPLSDSKIAQLLEQQGINVARRTVAKYRESMAIPPSNERKRLG